MKVKTRKARMALGITNILLIIALILPLVIQQMHRSARKQDLLNNSPAHLVTAVTELPTDCTDVHIVPKSQENWWIERLPSCREGLYILTCDTKHSNTTIAEVAACTQIERLTISSIQLENLDAISQMPQLHEFYYDSDQDSLPKDALSFTGDFPALTALTLKQVTGADLTAFGRVTTLKSVDAAINEQLTDIAWMASLTNLTELHLSNTAVEDISALANCKQLRELHLDFTRVHDITALSDLTQLEEFTAMQNYIHDETPRIADITPLANKPNLRVIDLYGTDVADITPLSNLPALEKLELAYTRVKDLDPAFTMPALTFLSWYDTDATCKDFDALHAFLSSHSSEANNTDANNSAP